MLEKRRSLLKDLLRRVPMPVLAALFGLLTAAAVWIVIDPIQTRAINNIFRQELSEQLETRARESMLRFDSFVQSYVNTTRLLANHRRMADYLEPLVWFSADDEPPLVYRERPPLWLPVSAIEGLPVRPSHAILADVEGKIREIYQLSDQGLPPEASQEISHVIANIGQQAYMTRLDGQLYRCPPWRAKRRRVVPGSREATRDTRRAEGAKGDPKGASERGVQSYGRPVCSRNELAMLWRNAG